MRFYIIKKLNTNYFKQLIIIKVKKNKKQNFNYFY